MVGQLIIDINDSPAGIAEEKVNAFTASDFPKGSWPRCTTLVAFLFVIAVEDGVQTRLPFKLLFLQLF